MTKLSHSAASKYQQCGRAYKLHYIDKIRPKVTGASLVFGGAIDEALNSILSGKDDYKEVFLNKFTNTTINKVDRYIPTYLDVVYSTADFDADLITDEDREFIAEKSGHPNVDDSISQVRTKRNKSGLESLTENERLVFNLANWCSLKQKGLLMLDAYKKKVLPKIKKVIDVQKKVTLRNSDGDEIVGYVDLVAEIEGHGVVILDNKTSAMDYEDDSVIVSPQLSLYVHILEDEYKTRKAGYIVMKKTIAKNKSKICKSCGYDGSEGRHTTCSNTIDGKRCGGEYAIKIKPEVFIQFIVDEIPEKTEEIVLENFDVINDGIKKGVFHRNFNSCQNWYGNYCPYIGLCYRNQMKGLIKE